MTPFLWILGPKKQFLRGFINLFSELLDCSTSYSTLNSIQFNPLAYFIANQPKKVKWVWSLGQNLGKLAPNVVKNKETGISMGFFHILHEAYK